MATLILFERSRERVRDRPRPNAPGNFITKQDAATVFTLTYPKTEKNYIASKLYPKVESKALGYYDDPAPNPPWVPLGPAAQPQKINYPPGVQDPIRQPPDNVPPGVNPVIPISARPGSQGVYVPGVNPSQLFPTTLKVRRVTIIADSANALTIWIGYNPTIAPDIAFPLAPGAARDMDVDDASYIWLVGENATDQVFFIYEV